MNSLDYVQDSLFTMKYFFRINLTLLIAFVITQVAMADYLGTISNRPFMDPASIPVIIDGYQVGDQISYISESTPNPAHSPVGAGAWVSAYLAKGAVVINAEIVSSNPDGTYSAIPMSDISDTADQCGPRGCLFPDTGTLQNGKLNESQQDTGIFYSTDPQTAKLASPLSISPTGPKVKPQNVHNQWDYNQVLAYGTGSALSGNGGKGNTPVTLIGGIWYGSGSPVAGPDTYFTNDYDPSCGTNFETRTRCTGPWKRISYPNSKIASSGPVLPTDLDDGNLVNNSVPTSAGHNFASGALPSNANALRLVFGERRIGELEYVRVTYQITNASTFINSINAGDICFDATGGDTDKVGRGPQDNNWRYYEGNAQACFAGSSAASMLKTITHIDNVVGGGTALKDSVIAYELGFYNTGTATIYDVQISDTPLDNDLTLLPPGSTNCPYTSYNGDLAGAPIYTGIAGNTASWATIPSLGSGAGVTMHVCAEVPGGANAGDSYVNEAVVTYSNSSGGATEPALSATATIVVSSKISGTVFVDLDATGTLTTGDAGIMSATVKLYEDVNGDGFLNTGDTLFQTKVTNNAGGYAFTGLDGGKYLVVESVAGYLSNADFDTALGGCASGNGCDVIAVTLNNESANTGNNFSNIGATIGDLIFTDVNGNGAQDTGDTGVAGVTVDLLDAASTVIATKTTDGSGLYSFSALSAGDYTVAVTDTGGVLAIGTSHAQTSDPDPVIDGATTITAVAGQTIDIADFGYQPLAVSLALVKTVQVLNDPVNGTNNPKAIPGAEIIYTIAVTNAGSGATDADSLVITDNVPANMAMFVGDFGVVGGGPVTLAQGTTPSDATYSFISLNNNTDGVGFSSNGGANYTYVPSPDVDGYDQNVNVIQLMFGGFIGGSNGVSHPSFEIKFKMLIR